MENMRTIHISQAGVAVFALIVSACTSKDSPTSVTPTLTSIFVTPSPTTVTVGSTVQLAFLAKDQSGNPLSGVTATWTSSDATIASVSTTGLVTGVAVGTATLIATSGTVRGTLVIAVAPGTYPIAATVAATTDRKFLPPQVDIAKGGSITWQFASLVHNVIWDGSATGTPDNIATTSNTTGVRTFTTSGSFAYHCSIHPSMVATVVVH